MCSLSAVKRPLQVFGQWSLPEEGAKHRVGRKQEPDSVASERKGSHKDGVKKGEKTSMWFQARHAPYTMPSQQLGITDCQVAIQKLSLSAICA